MPQLLPMRPCPELIRSPRRGLAQGDDFVTSKSDLWGMALPEESNRGSTDPDRPILLLGLFQSPHCHPKVVYASASPTAASLSRLVVRDDGLVADLIQNVHPAHALVLGDNGVAQAIP